MATKNKIHQFRHPIWSTMHKLWRKWRLCYEGGDAFKNAFLERYSKREEKEFFDIRKKLTYVPGHAGSVINIVRNALAVKMPEVTRSGDPRYETAMRTDVDTFRSSMTSFMALQVVPLLLAQGRRYIALDAPPAVTVEDDAPVTLAEDQSRPFMWAVNAEDVLSWSYDGRGHIKSALLQILEETEDEVTGLVESVRHVFRFMKRLEEGEQFIHGDIVASGPGVLIVDLGEDEKPIPGRPARVIPMARVPLVELSLVDALMSGIADHQITALQLASTDIDFLWKGNFPMYTEQTSVDSVIIPRGQKASQASTDSQVDLSSTEKAQQQEGQVGVGVGRTYQEGQDRPGFIGPSTENVRASMEKQMAIAVEIRSLLDLALASLSVKAVEQSGKAKEADRIGEEAGLAYIGRVLETGEREVASIFHELLGAPDAEFNIAYPSGYSVRTVEQRLEEANSLRKLRSATRSPLFQTHMDMRITEILLKPLTTEEELNAVMLQLQNAVPFDDDRDRALVIQADAQAGLVSPDTASLLRSYPAGEAQKAVAARVSEADAIASGEPAPGGPE